MELKISDKTEHSLLARTELNGLIAFDTTTPSRFDVRKKIAEALKSEASLITVTSISTTFGSKSAKIKAHVYKSKEDMNKFASKTVLDRHLTKEEKDKAKKGEAAPKDAAPVEKKEEPKKAEVKKEQPTSDKKPEKVEEKKEATK